jgi:membrane-bound serine protease (ClpP class)
MRPVTLSVLFAVASTLCGAQRVSEVAVDSVVSPVTTEILSSAIEEAAHAGDALLIVRLNTPGGLSEAMRESVEKLISSPIPVVTFVAPQGARAASAGFFILEAGDVAAMSHGSNTGAAHPVILGSEMDPVMKEKLENDAAASLRSIVGRRGRNVELAESAVRQSKSFTEKEALDGHLIEIIAADEADLLRQLDGREVTRFNGGKVTLRVRGAEIVAYNLSPRQRVMVALSDPNMALILLALGVLGIYLEFSAPGLIFPGVAGSILALLGLAALSVLPLNWLGVSLVLLALAMFVLEMKFASHGILSAGGAVALVLGATMLVDSPIPEMRIHLSTALGVAAPLAMITALLVTLVVRARRNKVVTGAQGMIGELGIALDDLSPEGRIFVHGENWLAQSPVNVPRGGEVRVLAIRNLRLRVEPVAASDEKELR